MHQRPGRQACANHLLRQRYYFNLQGKFPFKRLIYPVPNAAGLGVHLTIDLGCQARFGPDVEWVNSPDELDVDPSRGDAFYAEVRKYWPGLQDGTLQAGYAGVRPKLQDWMRQLEIL